MVKAWRRREMASKVQALPRQSSVEVGCLQVSGFREDAMSSRTAHSLAIAALEELGLVITLHADDRREVPTDFRYLALLLHASEDPEVGLAGFAGGVRVGSTPGIGNGDCRSRRIRWITWKAGMILRRCGAENIFLH